MNDPQENPMDIPQGSAIITPNMMHATILDVDRKVDKLVSSFDPWQQEMRNAVQSNASRIELSIAERKSEDEKLSEHIHTLDDKLSERIRNLETAGFVTSTRMWTVVAVLAAVIVSAITVITFLQQT